MEIISFRKAITPVLQFEASIISQKCGNLTFRVRCSFKTHKTYTQYSVKKKKDKKLEVKTILSKQKPTNIIEACFTRT